jgi:hypothetical protein
MISKADEGNSIIIVYQNEYDIKVVDFVWNNNLRSAKNDPTKDFKISQEQYKRNSDNYT